MAQSDPTEDLAVLDVPTPRLPLKSPLRPLITTEGRPVDEIDKAAEESQDDTLQKEAPPRNRATRRAESSKARHKGRRKGKDKIQNAGAEGSDDDSAAGARLDPAHVLHRIKTELAVPPEVAGAAWGIGRNSAYAAIHKGDIKSVRVGHLLMCPTAPLRRQLGIDPPLPGEKFGPQVAAPSPEPNPMVRQTTKPRQKRRR